MNRRKIVLYGAALVLALGAAAAVLIVLLPGEEQPHSRPTPRPAPQEAPVAPPTPVVTTVMAFKLVPGSPQASVFTHDDGFEITFPPYAVDTEETIKVLRHPVPEQMDPGVVNVFAVYEISASSGTRRDRFVRIRFPLPDTASLTMSRDALGVRVSSDGVVRDLPVTASDEFITAWTTELATFSIYEAARELPRIGPRAAGIPGALSGDGSHPVSPAAMVGQVLLSAMEASGAREAAARRGWDILTAGRGAGRQFPALSDAVAMAEAIRNGVPLFEELGMASALLDAAWGRWSPADCDTLHRSMAALQAVPGPVADLASRLLPVIVPVPDATVPEVYDTARDAARTAVAEWYLDALARALELWDGPLTTNVALEGPLPGGEVKAVLVSRAKHKDEVDAVVDQLSIPAGERTAVFSGTLRGFFRTAVPDQLRLFYRTEHGQAVEDRVDFSIGGPTTALPVAIGAPVAEMPAATAYRPEEGLAVSIISRRRAFEVIDARLAVLEKTLSDLAAVRQALAAEAAARTAHYAARAGGAADNPLNPLYSFLSRTWYPRWQRMLEEFAAEGLTNGTTAGHRALAALESGAIPDGVLPVGLDNGRKYFNVLNDIYYVTTEQRILTGLRALVERYYGTPLDDETWKRLTDDWLARSQRPNLDPGERRSLGNALSFEERIYKVLRTAPDESELAAAPQIPAAESPDLPAIFPMDKKKFDATEGVDHLFVPPPATVGGTP